MWKFLTEDAVVTVYLAVLTVIAVYGFHRYALVYLYLKHRKDGYLPKSKFATLPRITVQLPMYNEDVVAERIIRATCSLAAPLAPATQLMK